MVIGIDGNTANVTEPVGVSVYTRELLKYFHSQASKDTKFVVYLKYKPLADLPAENENFTYTLISPSFLWNYWSMPFYFLTNKKPDVFFSPAHYTPYMQGLKTVVTIHDFAYKYFPDEFKKSDLFKLTRWTEWSLKSSKKVICVSDSTKSDVGKFYPKALPKAVSIHNGFSKSDLDNAKEKEFFMKEVEGKKLLVNIHDDPYILFVGTLQPRKNIVKLVEAFEEFYNKHPEFFLLLVGKKGWLYEEILNKINNSPARNRIFLAGSVSEHDLQTYYKNAFATVLPSLYEGFGLPVLEALSNNSPVIASDNSSLPEVGGDAILYCDPTKPDTIVSSLEKLLDKATRASLLQKSKQQLKKFSWDKCGKETLEVLKEVVNQR